MTVSKMPLSRPESIRCPDASTTSEATDRLSHAVVAHHDERDVVARSLAISKCADVGEQVFEELRGGFRRRGAVPFVPSWTDVVAPVAVGGVWLAAFLGQLQQQPLMPTYDPRLRDVTHHE